MITMMKTPLTGFLLAGVAAVLPTVIVASLCAQSTPPAASPTGSADELSQPTTRPSQYGGGHGGGGSGAPFGGDGRNRLGPQGRLASAEEIQAAIEFFNQNSPNRMVYFNKLAEGSQARRRQSLLLVQFYRPILNFKESNPDLYDLMVQQVKMRDDAFELAKDGEDAKLREKARDIVNISLQARTKRLALLQKELAQQQTKLAEDTANPDAAAEQEVNSIKEDEQRLVLRAEHPQSPSRGQSMLDFDPATDPLAEAAPITGPADLKQPPDSGQRTVQGD
jgi:hypothetical protein